MSHFEYGKGKYRVWADSIPAGDELVVFIGGGEKPHIGSVSISEKTGNTFSFSVPEHKDYIVANDAARRISEVTGRRCLVVVGIHIQNASKLEIKKFLENSGKCVDKLVEKIGA